MGPRLRFGVNSKVFYKLGLGLNPGGMHWLTALMAILVDVAASGGLYLGFGLGLDSFFDQSVPTV